MWMLLVELLADAPEPDLWLGVLPKWVGDLFALAGPVLGIPAIILFLLGKNNANRSLQVDESGAEVSEFEALRKAYKEDKAEAEAKRIAAELKSEGVSNELASVHEEVNELRSDVGILRRLITSLVRRNRITMTDDERRDFEATKPRGRPRAAAKK